MNSIARISALAMCVFVIGQVAAEDKFFESDGVRAADSVVRTASGKVRGVTHGDVVSFKGIPFAAPPVGELRWRAPQPPKSWEGVRNASEFGPACVQNWDGKTNGSEDCLYLNVWTPRERGDERLPVMIWIHGGGFVNGATAGPLENGSRLARDGVVLVSVGYRLGRFGFFAHPALTAENADGGRLGNYAIMDQIAALQWVRDNIAAFGGDPKNVTVAGGSAGGFSVNYLMTSPLTRGLFARAIVQSGAGRLRRLGYEQLLPFRPLTTQGPEESAESQGVRFAAANGIQGTDPEVLKALRALPAAKIVGGMNMLNMVEHEFGGAIGDGVVLPSHYELTYRAGKEHPVPLIIGATDADGFYNSPADWARNEEIFAPFGAFRAEAEAIYDDAGNGEKDRISTYVSADTLFIEPTRLIARLHAATGHPTYQFRFSYVPDHLREKQVGAKHSSDVQFVFGTLDSFISPTENDKRVSDQVQAYWLSFIHDGVPNPDGLPEWPAFDPENDVILDFRTEGPTVGPDPARKRLDLVERVAESKRQDLQGEASISIPGAESRVYKTVGDTQLRLHIFNPPGAGDQARPAIVYFFGGGWMGGSVTQLAPRSEYFCSRGMVAVAADYRVKSRHAVGAFECVADAKSAIRWLRAHAAELGIDENRIVAAGGSSGGHLAASTALIDGFDELNEDLAVSSVPNALVLHSPALDLPAIFAAMGRENAVAQFGEWVRRCEPISPLAHVRPDAPPTIIFHGTADRPVPFEHSQRFAMAMRAQGNRCELVAYDGRSHGFSLLESGDGSDFSDTLLRTDKFLISLDYLTGKPIADAFTYTKQVDRFFESDGVKIRYIDVGPRDGEPVVLLHGFSQRLESAWLETGVIDALDDEFRVIALDWRGHGKSDTPHDSSKYGSAVAGDVIRLLDHLNIDKAHIVGYSMGGHITFRLLADHPDRILTAIPCADGGTHYPDEFTEVSQRSVESLMASGSIRPLIDYFAFPDSLTEDQAQAIVESQRSSNDVKALAAVMQSFRALDADPVKLADNTVPCLAIIGEHDPFRAGLQDTANNMTNIEVEVIKGQDHITALHTPEFTAAVRRFIGAHRNFKDHFFDSKGVRIRYIDVGPRDGEPIVLIHGGFGSIEWHWGESGVIDALDDDYRVIALDCRGHGKSDKPRDPEMYRNEMVDDVVRLLDHLKIKKAHIVGYSLGGRIAYKLVAGHPKRVISAMPCGIDGEPASEELIAASNHVATALENTENALPILKQAILAQFNTDGSMTEDEANQFVQRLVETNDIKAIPVVLRGTSELAPNLAKLKSTTVPCLCLIGEHDPNLPATRKTAEYMANLDIKVIGGANHLNAYRHPVFVASIKAFVGKHAAVTNYEDYFFDSDGVRLRYIDVGPRDGEPVVLVHGGFATVEWQWGQTGVIDSLDDDYRVIALDLRGHGKSSKPHDVTAYGNQFVEDVVRLLDHLKINQAHVVGYSLGGRIVFKLVSDHPERLISAMPCGTDAEPPTEERVQSLQAAAKMLKQSRDVRPMLAQFNTDGALTAQEIDREAARLNAMNDFEAFAAMIGSVAELAPDRARLKTNTVPSKCVIGANDTNLPAAKQTAEYMANFELQILEGKSHLTAYREPAFATAIKSFLVKHGQENSADDETPGDAQLFENMGPYHREFTTDSELAQKYLNQGMVWIQAFNHDEAILSFLKAAELDPKCAWAWWGVAYSEGPNYNDPHPDDNRSRAAWYALQNALARIENASIVERDLIIALKSRYSNPWAKDRSKLDQAYADVMALVWEKYSNDADVGVLYAEAMMQLKPWELYTMDRKPVGGTMKIRSVLEKVMKLDTSHAGAKHLYIHAVEPNIRPDDALEAAHELENLVPASGHLLHMPSHIYVQTGHWQKAIDQNAKAVDSDTRYRELSPSQANQYGYQFHNSHMLVFAAMMVGQEKTAMKYAREMWSIIPKDEMEEKGPDIDFSLMCVYDVQKRFGRWDDILEEPAPPDYLLLTTAYWRTHRAIANAAKKQFDDAENEFVEFLNAKAKVPKDSIEDGTFYHRALKVSEHFIQGEIALHKQDWSVAIWHLEKAAEVEDTLRYTEPPYWLQPVRHALGAVYMKAGMLKEAEQTYRKDLSIWRDNGWSLYGLSEALAAQGKSDEALVEMAKFKRVWENADEQLLTTSCKCIENLNK